MKPDFIEVYDDVVTEDIVDRYINFFNASEDKTQGVTYDTSVEKLIVDHNVKQSTDLSSRHIPHNLQIDYLELLHQCLLKYVEKYDYARHTARFDVNQHFNVQYYPPGGGFKKWHCELVGNDNNGYGTRHLVFMTYLTTVKNGGGTEFLYQERTIDSVKGRTVIWPTTFPWTHRGVIAPNEEKMIITGWWSFCA